MSFLAAQEQGKASVLLSADAANAGECRNFWGVWCAASGISGGMGAGMGVNVAPTRQIWYNYSNTQDQYAPFGNTWPGFPAWLQQIKERATL
jgi:hypothetical protein